MPRELSQVYLITIDDVSGNAIRRALELTREQICPAGWTHFQPTIFADGQNNESGLQAVQRIMWYSAWKESRRASHLLFIQYDGWVLDGSLWKDSWLYYDYIGASWPWISNPSEMIGNGGFSLRSVRLMKHIAENPKTYPLFKDTPEDVLIGRKYRPLLEDAGFRFAPLYQAHEFSFERGLQCPTFGFHGIYNIPKVLSPEEWSVWKASANDYIRSKSEWQEVKDL